MARSGPGRKPKRAKPAPAGWERFFPFPRGGAFEVRVSKPRLPVRGHGTVLQRSATRLHVEVEVPGLLVFPRVRVEVILEVPRDARAGSSGTVDVTIGKRRLAFTDDELTVRSSAADRMREISTSRSHQGYSGTAVIRSDQDGLCHVSAMGFEVMLSGRLPEG
jgi:hypothetical protein